MDSTVTKKLRSIFLLSALALLVLAPLPCPALVAMTHEVFLEMFGRVTEPVARAQVSPGAASIAVANLEAAALCVRPQRSNEGTQDIVDVVSEENALFLDGLGRSIWLHTGAHTDTHTDNVFSHAHLVFGEFQFSPQHNSSCPQ